MEKQLFCAKCQLITTHLASIDANGEFLFQCQNVIEEVPCDRFVKFPADMDKADFKVAVVTHKSVNEGQVSVEVQEKRLAEFLADNEEEITPEAPAEPQE